MGCWRPSLEIDPHIHMASRCGSLYGAPGSCDLPVSEMATTEFFFILPSLGRRGLLSPTCTELCTA